MTANNGAASGGLLKDFSNFIMQGNVVDLAVAVVIGAAFGKIVSSLIEDLITPIILNPAIKAAGVENIAQLSANGIKYGSFLAAVINFLVISFVIFLLVRALEQAKKRLTRKEALAAMDESDPVVVAQEQLIASIDRLNQTISSKGM
jgi:large conductance mechanosensitive channel